MKLKFVSLLFGVIFVLSLAGLASHLTAPDCLASQTVCPEFEKAAQISAHYYWYNQQNFEAASTRGDRIVLFFYAPWCGSCSGLDDELYSQGDTVPEDLSVLKVQYDKDKILKNKYAVTTQHTLVWIDENGNEISKWVGGDIATLRKNLKEAQY